MPVGIPPDQLTDEDLERELTRLHETRRKTFHEGTADALRNHTDRMLALEQEYTRRFPDRVNSSAQVSRKAAHRA